MIVVIFATLAVVPARAHTTTYSGSIRVGHVLTDRIGGITELLARCTPEHDLNGVDGVWFAIDEHRLHAVTLIPVGTNASSQDLNAYFYSSSCAYIGAATMSAGGRGETERGFVPPEAAYVIVDLYAGFGASFELRFSDGLEDTGA